MTLPIPTVTITVQDNGASAALSVPQASVQLVVGVAVGGTPNQPYATTNPQGIQMQYIGGPLVEAAGLVAQAGGVALCISCPVATLGTANAVQATVPNGSTSVFTTTLDSTFGAWDRYFIKVRCLKGQASTTAGGGILQVSFDAGRNWGWPITLAPAQVTLYLGSGVLNAPTVGGTGVQLAIGTGTLVAGDSWQFSTVAPTWNDAGVEAALTAFFASQYAVQGVGSIHIVGTCAGGDITAIQTSLQTGTNGYVYTRAIVELRDALDPVAYGGAGETEATWMAALATIASGEVAQARICADGGYYNTPSPYANATGGTPSYRRSLAWSHAVRRTGAGMLTGNPLATRAGRVKDGPYGTIAVNPASDPGDGFIYHDERVTPGLNAARIGSAQTWPKKGAGFFQCQEPLLSAPGSQFVEVVIGNVLDAACDIGYAAGVEEVSDNLQLQANGTLNTVALNQFQGNIQGALSAGLVKTPLVSAVTTVVSPTQNVATSGNIPITISVLPFGYVNAVSETINLSTGTT
jgi:hypothetical protein